MVLTPAPARTISDSAPASSIGVGHLRRSHDQHRRLRVVRIAATSASPLASGWNITSQPAAFSAVEPGLLELVCDQYFHTAVPSGVIGGGIDACQIRATEPVAQLRLEPGGLGRHDAAGIGDAHQIVDRAGYSENATANLPASTSRSSSRCRGCRRRNRCACRCARRRCRAAARGRGSAADRRRARRLPAGMRRCVYHCAAEVHRDLPLPPARPARRRAPATCCLSASRNAAGVRPFRS